MVDSALRPKSPLSAKPVLIQWDLRAPCYKQQAEARDGQPSRSNDSTLLSAMCCQREGCHPDLFWLVSINPWETKWGEKAEGSLVCTCVQNSLTAVLYDMLYVVFRAPIHHWPPFWSTRGFRTKTSCLPSLYFPPCWSLNDLGAKSSARPKWPCAAVTIRSHEPIIRQIIHGNENSLFPPSFLPYSESPDPTRPLPTTSLSLSLSLWAHNPRSESQDKCGFYATLASCASLKHVEVQLPNSVSSISHD